MNASSEQYIPQIDNSLLKTSIKKRYNRSVGIAYLIAFLLTLIFTFNFYLYEKQSIIREHQERIEQNLLSLDNALSEELQALYMLDNAAIEYYASDQPAALHQWQVQQEAHGFTMKQHHIAQESFNRFGVIKGLQSWERMRAYPPSPEYAHTTDRTLSSV